MILMIDNFDSFTYNLVQYLRQLGAEVQVARNNALTIDAIARMAPEAIVVSPGPGQAPDGRHIDGGHPHLFRTHSDLGNLPWSPGHCRHVREQDRSPLDN